MKTNSTAPLQGVLFDGEPSPAEKWNHDSARRALDDLFCHSRQYKSSRDYHALMEFIARFRFYSPFNAMLIHVQMPGAVFVAPAHRWQRDYGRQVKAGTRPLVILQPRGPVMFVFDVSDTESDYPWDTLPREVTQPFETFGGIISGELDISIRNAVRDGIAVAEQKAGSQSAGEIRTVEAGRFLKLQTATRPQPTFARVPRRYELLLNASHTSEEKYATLVHELAHLYCGHLGTPDETWWPDRRGVSEATAEFEAESVCYLVCGRLGITTTSERYLADYLDKNADTPLISLDCVMKAAGLIEQMGRETLKPRKEAV